MSPVGPNPRIRVAVISSALCLVALGGLFLFAPRDVTDLFGKGASGPLVQLFGAALLGFGAMNWVIRDATLGGIYGKAVLVGNQAHWMIGALLLVKNGAGNEAAAPPALWALTALYVLGAVLFTYLTFFSKGVPRGR